MGLQDLPQYTDSLRRIRERPPEIDETERKQEFAAQYPSIREELSQIPIEDLYTQPKAIELLEQLYLFRGGWRPSESIKEKIEFDNYIEIEDVESAELPSSFSLKDQFTPVEEQSTNACTAYAVTGLLEYWGVKAAIAPFQNVSALFLYKFTRLLDQKRKSDSNFDFAPTVQQDLKQIVTLSSTVITDEGASFRDTFEILQKIGIVTEQDYPSNQTLQGSIQTAVWDKRISMQDWSSFRLEPEVSNSKILLTKVKLCLVSGIPCVFGFKEFPILESTTGGTIPYQSKEQIEQLKKNAPKEILFDGHALTAVGYDDDHNNGPDTSPGALLIRNSWGEDWGDKGYAWLPYAYIDDGQTLEWWSLMNAKELKALAERKKVILKQSPDSLSEQDTLELKDIKNQEDKLAQLKWLKDGSSKQNGFGIVQREGKPDSPPLGKSCEPGEDCKPKA